MITNASIKLKQFLQGTTAMAQTSYSKSKPASCSKSKLYAISDLHVDIKENREFVESWSDSNYQEDGLIVAGDVTDFMSLLKSTLQALKFKFREVFFVPGNHELWIHPRRGEKNQDSIKKFHEIIEMCDDIGVKTRPTKFVVSPTESVQVVPLFSWYSKPEEDMADTLYLCPEGRTEDVEFMEQSWMDNYLCKWDTLPQDMTKAEYFSALNEPYLHQDFHSPVVSFSHFVPNQSLVLESPEDRTAVKQERLALGLGEPPFRQGGLDGFNFTRYAGSKLIQKQVDQLKSAIHVFGHQHRNRDRAIGEVRYVSHCLGNRKEQKEGWVWGISMWKGPKQIWPPADGPSTSS